MITKRRAILLSLVAVWIVRLQPVHADNGLLVVSGGAAEHERAVVGGAIESAIRKSGWSLPANLLTKRETDGLLNCPDSMAPWRCIPASLGTTGVHGVFVVSVDSSQAENGAPLVIITGKLIVTNPPSFTIRQRFCEHCADDRLGQAGEDLTQQLVHAIAARSDGTAVTITSMPAGAEIILDGVRMGATDSTFDTYPATHVVIVQKPGFTPETREVVVEDGKATEVSVKLRVSHTPLPREPHRIPPSRLLPDITIAAGVALVVFGGFSIYRGQLGGPDEKYIYTRGTLVGVTSGLLGLGTAGFGFYFRWRDSNRTASSAGITPGGAVIGWAGRF